MIGREWAARAGGALAAALLATAWPALAAALPLLGLLALARALAQLSALWLAPALPWRRLVRDVGRRAVLVTGCDSGFGLEAALRLHARGAPVLAAVLLPEGPGAARLRQLGAASARMRVLPLDVTDDASVAAAAADAARALDDAGWELWAVVNNAGVLGLGEAEWMQLDDVKRCFDVNALGQMRVTKAFLPLLKKSKGRVVNINSTASRLVPTSLTPYVVSKFASLAFTESLRIDMGKFSVSVHSVEPNIFKTAMFRSAIPLYKKKLENIPPEIMQTYCERYTDKLMFLVTMVNMIMASPESKIYQVIDSIEDACLAQDPLKVYRPGERTKLFYSVSEIFSVIQEQFVKIIYR